MIDKSLPKSFDELLEQSERPVLADFWAEWCGACKILTPVIERIASEFKGKIITVKINVDKKPYLASRYQITGIPTIMLFRKGQILMRVSGAMPFDSLKSEINSKLNG